MNKQKSKTEQPTIEETLALTLEAAEKQTALKADSAGILKLLWIFSERKRTDRKTE